MRSPDAMWGGEYRNRPLTGKAYFKKIVIVIFITANIDEKRKGATGTNYPGIRSMETPLQPVIELGGIGIRDRFDMQDGSV